MPAQNRERVDKERTYYHIYNKGVESRILFSDEEDYEVFIGYLEDYLAPPKDPDTVKKVFEIKGRTFRGTPHQPKNYFQKVELIAYSLMPNHFHLLLHQITSGSQEKFIRSLATRYSMYFNKKHERSGSLFEGPYKSIPIDKGRLLTYLTYFFHKASSHSSYAEYLGTKKTSWIKPQSVLDFFKNNIDSYKYFIEKNSLSQEEKELIDSITFASDVQCVERRDLTSSQPMDITSPKKSLPKVVGFLTTSTIVFLMLVGLGVRNINSYGLKSSQALPVSEVLPAKTHQTGSVAGGAADPITQVKSKLTPGATSAAIPEKKSEVNSLQQPQLKSLATVNLNEGVLNVNIREQPSTDSAKIGKAGNGDTFEIVSEGKEWYEIKLSDGHLGFISAKYIGTNQKQQ